MEKNVDLLDSLDFKLKSAFYHKEKCLEAIDKPVLFENEEARLVAVSSEFTAMMLVFQSSIDILAQFINKKRELEFDPFKLYFSCIMNSDFFNKTTKLEGIKEQLSSLHKESRYLFGYCNTIKHRNLIHISDEWYFISAYQTLQCNLVNSFYHYPEKELNELIFDTYDKITIGIKNIISHV